MTKLTMEQKVDKILEFFKFDSDKWPCKVDKSLDDLENKLDTTIENQENIRADLSYLIEKLNDVELNIDAIREESEDE